MALDPQTRELGKRMSRIARRFRSENPLADLDWDAGCYFLPTGTRGDPHFKPLVWFPSPGCVWSLHGGCSMCDFGRAQGEYSDEEILAAFDGVLDSIGNGVQRIHLGPGGSFFTDAEVSPRIRREVIRRLERLPFLRYVGIETRAPFVTAERLEEVIEVLPPGVQSLTLGFGLECVSDLPRVAAINKGYGPRQVEHALATMRAVEEAHPQISINFEIYAMLKPLFLAEGEAIDEALKTIEWAIEHEAESVVLFLNTVKENTLQHLFHTDPGVPHEVRYEPPYYRSAIEVLRQLSPVARERTVVLGPQSAVPAASMPRGCALCTWPLNGTLVAHNLYHEPRLLHAAAETTCPCKPHWEGELAQPSDPLPTRIARGFDWAERELSLVPTG